MGVLWLLVFIFSQFGFSDSLRTIFLHPLNQTIKSTLKSILPDSKIFDYNYRLSGDIVPLEYHISLDFDIQHDDIVHGSERIVVMATKDTQVLTLHVNKMYVDISYAAILFFDGTYMLENPIYNKTRLTVTYNLPKKLKQNVHYGILFKFNTKIYEKNPYERFQKGIMKSTTHGKKVFFTLFEMLGARRAFPCFDEPQLKANYQLNITIAGNPDSKYIALSNSMSLKRGNTWHFHKTLKMSSYLLNIVIGSYKSACSMGPQAICGTSVVPGQSKKVCQWMPHSLADRANMVLVAEDVNKFAVDVYCKMQNYINVESPAQLHMVWVPLGSLAIEHWGLISMPLSGRMQTTLAHEISHYWFGDLVSPGSWPHLWLNEGFVSYITELSNTIFHKNRRGIIVDAQGRASRFYDKPNTESVVSKLWANDYGTSNLYRINYDKGQLIALMAESILGKEKFRKALHNHMKARAYGNANTDELLKAIQKVSDNTVNVARVLERFLTYGGKPNLKIVYNKSKRIYNVHKNVPSGTARDWILPLWAYDISRNISTINWIKDKTTIIELSKITTSGNAANIEWNYYHFAYCTFQVVNQPQL